MKRITLCLTICLMAFATAKAGPKWEFGEKSWMKAAFLGQAHYSMPDNAAYDQDFYLRRGRIILMGQMMDGVKFFAETDNDKAGKKGTSVSTDIQDAFIDVRLFENDNAALWVEGGLILLPFSFEGTSSAVSLLGLDYNAEIMKLANTFVWRDNGAMLHGHIAKKVDVRVGAFDGYDSSSSTKSDEAGIRLTGHIGIGIIGEVNTGWFASQNRLGADTYLTVGAGFDMQDKANAITTTDAAGVSTETGQKDNEAWCIDFQSGVKLSDTASLTVNGGFYDWDNAVFEGTTACVEAGLLIDKYQVTYKFATQDPDGGSTTDDHTVGLHYFQKKHNARYGVEYRSGDSDDWTLVGVQFFL